MNFAIAEKAIGEFVLDNSVPSAFQELLKNPEADLQYLIELSPYNTTSISTITGVAPIATNAIGEFDFNVIGGVETIYISDTGYTTNSNESPPDRVYLPFTDNPFQYEVSILNGDEFRGGGGSFGSIRLLNGDGDFDYVTDYYWQGRDVKVLVGGIGFARDKFVTAFDGVVSEIEYSEDEIIIDIQSLERILDTDFVQTLYLGTGGLEGGADIEGKPKPLAYGEVRNITPVLVDSANLIYQVHDGSVEAIDAVYDRGVEIGFDSDSSDITTSSPLASKFTTQLSGGYFKLGSQPAGQVTADVRGDNTGGYVNLSGAIAKRLVKTKLESKNFADSQIDSGALNALDALITDKIGIYIDRNTSARQILNNIFGPIQTYWTFTRAGLFTAGVIESPDAEVYTINESQIIDDTFETVNVSNATWRLNIGYGKNWTVQNENELAAGATTAQKDFAQKQYRNILDEDRGVRTKSGSFVERSFNTLFVDEPTTELTRIKGLYNTLRKTYRFQVKELLFIVYIGDVVKVVSNRFGLSGGKNFLIVGINEDAETNHTTLEVWG